MVHRLPPNIHVDANMHPWLYQHLHVFPFIFDEVSVWAFHSDFYAQHNRTVLLDDLWRLISAQPPALRLSCADDWYTKERRAKLPAFLKWTAFDERVAQWRAPQSLLLFRRPETMRTSAWDIADELTDAVRHQLGPTAFEALSGADDTAREIAATPEELAIAAHQRALSIFQSDLKRYEAFIGDRTGEDAEKAGIEFSSAVLPPIFLTAKKPDYRQRLERKEVLACLYYDHFTKAQVIDRISEAAGKRFVPFVFPTWHQLMTHGLGMLSSADDHDGMLTKLGQYREIFEAIGPFMVQHSTLVKALSPKEGDPAEASRVLVDTLLRWRALHGPALIRDLVEEMAVTPHLEEGGKLNAWFTATVERLRHKLREAAEADALERQFWNNFPTFLPVAVATAVALAGKAWIDAAKGGEGRGWQISRRSFFTAGASGISAALTSKFTGSIMPRGVGRSLELQTLFDTWLTSAGLVQGL